MRIHLTKSVMVNIITIGTMITHMMNTLEPGINMKTKSQKRLMNLKKLVKQKNKNLNRIKQRLKHIHNQKLFTMLHLTINLSITFLFIMNQRTMKQFIMILYMMVII